MSDPVSLSSPGSAAGLGLDPAFAAKIDQLIAACLAEGYEFRISQGTRTPQTQAQYYCCWDRHPPENVDAAAAKLAARGAPWLAALLRSYRDIPRSPRWLTNALPGAGWHQWGLAVDAYCYRNGVQVDDGDDACYKFYAEAATKLGLTAGYYFKQRDSGHVQGRPEGGAGDVFAWSYIDDEMHRRFGDKEAVALGKDVDFDALAAEHTASIEPTAAPATAAGSGFFKDDPALQSVAIVPDRPYKILPRTPAEVKRLAETYNRVGGLIERLAAQVSIDPFAVLAVWYVESGGRAFTPRLPVLRFENHKFYKYWGAAHGTAFDAHFQFGGHAGIPGGAAKNHKYRAGDSGAWQSVHNGTQTREYEVFRFAAGLASQEDACLSASFGGPQIMGFNHESCGYANASDLADAFGASERWQVLGFFDFCRSQNLIDKIRQKQWVPFGARYNGDGPTYGPLLKAAFDRKALVTALPRQAATAGNGTAANGADVAGLAATGVPSPVRVQLASSAEHGTFAA